MVQHTRAHLWSSGTLPRFGSSCLALAVLMGACAEKGAELASPVAAPTVFYIGGGVTAPDLERAALGTVARALAIALNDPNMRQLLKTHLRAAPYNEHKIELAGYLRRPEASPLLSKLANGAGQTASQMLATLQQVRSVELYMPVKAQRESWTGDTDLLVAAQLVEHDPIMGFDRSGNGVAMDESGPPDQSTIAIVGAETRWNQPMSLVSSRNANDLNGQAIGTLVPFKPTISNLVDCGTDCGGGGGGGGAIQTAPGLYLEFSRILDMKEPWVRGAPEVEVHIHGSTPNNDPEIIDDRACAGEHSPDPKYVFDQNDGFWSGQVMIFAIDSLANMPADRDYHIIFWEDDNDSCTLKLDSNTLRMYVLTAAEGFVKAAMFFVKGYTWPLSAVAFVGTFYSNKGEWMLTNDDYIGLARVSLPNYPYYYPDNTHVLIDENGGLNGRANINWH